MRTSPRVALTLVLVAAAACGGGERARIEPQPQESAVLVLGPEAADAAALGDIAARVQAEIDAYLVAVEAARVAEEQRRAVIWARWWTVGRCEQPTRDGGVEWTLVSSTYSGGLGISNAAWRQWGGLEFAPNAGLADPWSQMMIAERILGAVGRRAWGCPVP